MAERIEIASRKTLKALHLCKYVCPMRGVKPANACLHDKR